MSRYLTGFHGAFLALFLIFIAFPSPLLAAEGLTVFVDGVDSQEFPNVTVNLVVVDGKGLPVMGISQADIGLTEDGKPVTPQLISLSPLVAVEEPMAVTLVVDTSLSMQGEPWQRAREAASSFVDDLAAHDVAALISFSGEVATVSDFTADKASLKAALGSLALGPNTALFDALVASLDLAGRSGTSSRAIVLLTDGEDNGSKRNLESALKAASTARVPVYTIGLGESVDRRVLDRIAASTGGRSLYAPSAVDLQSTFAALSRQLKSRYVLRFQSKARADNENHALTVAVKHQGRRSESKTAFVAIPRPLRIAFLSPTETSLEGKSIPVEVKAESVAPIARVQFLVDGKVAYEMSRAPYRFVWYTDAWEAGPHSFTARVTDAIANTSTESLEVTWQPPYSPVNAYTLREAPAVPAPARHEVNAPTLDVYRPVVVVGALGFSLVLLVWLLANRNSGPVRAVSFFLWRLSRPRCPICRKRYSPAHGCAYCRQQEEKAIPKRLEQIFRSS